jgi:pimeloyl-ACP methyl ester carboxylesterase
MTRSTRLAALALLWSAGSAMAQTPRPPVPANLFPKPTGAYSVGTLDTLWVDERRDEVLTKAAGDKRHVPVQIWYPAESGSGEPAKYIQRPEEFGPQSPFKGVLHVVTNSVAAAPIATGGGKFPVLLYNHGGSWSRFTATFEFEQLASLGYVIVSVDHLGFDKSTALANGYTFVADTLGFPKPGGTDFRADATANWDYLGGVLFPTWVADARFVLDRIEGLNRDAGSRFRGRLDLDRIGAFGWSFGGATAVELSIVDSRVKAAIDQDGQLFGRARSTGSRRPVMLMHNTSDPTKGVPEANRPAMEEMIAQVRGWDSTFQAASTGPLYDVSIARTGHGHFSDLTLFFPKDTTAMEPSRAHEIITAYTVAFFDEFLRGKRAELLRSSPPWPEVTIRTARIK